MAGQFLQPENEVTIGDIVEEATQCNYTKHGEMFSAKNMVKLAKSVFPTCKAKKMTESSTILNSLENLLTLLCIDENLIMVPYDSDADQWPCNRKGERAHWGLIIGVAIILPYKNSAFDDAKPLDGFVSHLKPPITNEVRIFSLLDNAPNLVVGCIIQKRIKFNFSLLFICRALFCTGILLFSTLVLFGI